MGFVRRCTVGRSCHVMSCHVMSCHVMPLVLDGWLIGWLVENRPSMTLHPNGMVGSKTSGIDNFEGSMERRMRSWNERSVIKIGLFLLL